MALTRETMTDEQRKSVLLDYLKAFDNAGVIPTGGRTAPEPATEQRSSLRPVKTSQQRSGPPGTGRGTIFIRAQGRGDTTAPPPGPPGTESAGWRTLQDS
jgi:hypothetical protein